MNPRLKSKEEIRNVTHSMVDRKLWAEQLLARVKAVLNARGHERVRELHQLELVIRMEMEDAQVTGPLYHFIWENSEKLREKLTVMHNHLSDGDLFLCACIHSGISTTDVADIKGVTPTTINMTRYRLKKKLGLPQHQDLESYINSLIHIN